MISCVHGLVRGDSPAEIFTFRNFVDLLRVPCTRFMRLRMMQRETCEIVLAYAKDMYTPGDQERVRLGQRVAVADKSTESSRLYKTRSLTESCKQRTS